MFVYNIKRFRVLRRMTQKDLANAIGVDYSIISKYESGKVNPPPDRLAAIADALQVSVAQLVGAPLDDLPELRSDTLSLDEDKFLPTGLAEKAVLRQAEQCDLCGFRPRPGIIKDRFLVIHFIEWLSEGGRPVPENMAVLCPNCHKTLHMLNDPADLAKLKQIAASRILK